MTDNEGNKPTVDRNRSYLLDRGVSFNPPIVKRYGEFSFNLKDVKLTKPHSSNDTLIIELEGGHQILLLPQYKESFFADYDKYIVSK